MKQRISAEIMINRRTNRIEQVGFVRGRTVLCVRPVDSFTEALRAIAEFARSAREEIKWTIISA